MMLRSALRKFNKFTRHPGVFFRDYFLKRYPIVNNEASISEQDEAALIAHGLRLQQIEADNAGGLVPIDAVFTWVDGQDSVWQQRRRNHMPNPDSAVSGSDDVARFANHNELYYSVHSVKTYLPWIRRIYIVTDNQRPQWLSADDDKIRIIDHRQIIDPRYLPTFNSHVIEAHLHNIPDLSENFIYFNDDVFVARPLPPQHFFRSNGIASLFLTTKQISTMQGKGVKTPTIHACLNSKVLISGSLIDPDTPPTHTYIPLKKSIFRQIWQEHGQAVSLFLPEKFRSRNDLNLATFLAPWLMYAEGLSVPAYDICYYFNIRSAHARTQYAKLLTMKRNGCPPHSFCANDFNSNTHQTDYVRDLNAMLEQYYFKEEFL